MTRRIITTGDIAAMITRHVSCDDKIANDFLHEFCQVVTLALATDGYVNIDGLGVFRATADVDGKANVEFAPADSIAEDVNVQFAIFEPVELADDVSEQTLEEAPVPEINSAEEPESVVETPQEPEPECEPEPEPESVHVSVSQPDEVTEQMPVDEHATAPAEETVPVAEPARKQPTTVNEMLGARTVKLETPSAIRIETPPGPVPVRVEQREPMPVRVEHDEQTPVVREGHSNLTLIFAAVAALLLGLIVGLFIGYKTWHDSVAVTANNPASENVEVKGISAADSLQSVTIDAEKVEVNAPAPGSVSGVVRPETAGVAAQVVVTDTVHAGNFLTKMARRHYGDSKFWIYIYLENKEKITDPDNLPDGLVVIIPPAAKYNIDPHNPESVRQAERTAWNAAQ